MEVAGRKCSGSDTAKTCDSCAETASLSADRIAHGYCTDCRMYLCEDCCQVHRSFPQLKSHQILTGKHMPGEKITPVDNCESHENEKILYFCESHSALACQKCAILEHRGCNNIKDISALANEDKAEEGYKLLTQKIKTMDSNIHKNRQTVAENVSKIDSTKKQTKADIKQFCKAMRDYLYKIETSMDEELDLITQDDNKHMDKNQQELDSICADLKVVTTLLESNQGPNQREQLFIAIEKVTRTIEALDDKLTALNTDNTIKDYKFDPDGRLKSVMRDVKRVGRLVIRGDTRQKSSKLSVEDLVHEETGGDINVKAQTDYYTCGITGLIALEGDTTLALVDQINFAVKLVDVGQKKIISQLRLLDEPWDITQLHPDQLAVTLPNKHKIQFIQVPIASTLLLGRQVEVSGECRGITYNNDRLFVSFTNPVQVQILSMSGRVLHTVSSKTDGQIYFTSPLYITTSADKSLLYVSDSGTHTVYCLDTTGKLKCTFRDQSLIRPRGVCVGDDGSLIVCGYLTDNLYEISSDCGRGRVLLDKSRGVEDPWCVAYSNSNRTYYLSKPLKDTVTLFKLK